MKNPMMEMLKPNNPMQAFQKFAQSMTPQGAKQQVEQLLMNGKMSQQQFEQLKQQAQFLFGK